MRVGGPSSDAVALVFCLDCNSKSHHVQVEKTNSPRELKAFASQDGFDGRENEAIKSLKCQRLMSLGSGLGLWFWRVLGGPEGLELTQRLSSASLRAMVIN